jgi:hypothetical protein
MEKIEITTPSGRTMVAVLITPSYGAGWSSWNNDQGEKLLFDPTVVTLLTKQPPNYIERIKQYCAEEYPNIYLGGLEDLEVFWVPKGELFIIEEYDGFESIRIQSQVSWLTA